MKDQVTSIEQSRRLLELGVEAEKASMKWERYSYCVDHHGEEPITVWDNWSLEIGRVSMDVNNYQNVPAFTVVDLLGVLPHEINTPNGTYVLILEGLVGSDEWSAFYRSFFMDEEGEYDYIGDNQGERIIDILVRLVEWMVANGLKLKQDEK